MRSLLAMLLMLLAGCGQPPAQQAAPERVVEPRAFAGPAPRDTALLKQTMLTSHNAARAAVGVPPLAWNDALAADAQSYAEQMAKTGRFAHADQPRG
jgi:uncharacterized protein YkwD